VTTLRLDVMAESKSLRKFVSSTFNMILVHPQQSGITV
jgi:hypothetical protein